MNAILKLILIFIYIASKHKVDAAACFTEDNPDCLNKAYWGEYCNSTEDCLVENIGSDKMNCTAIPCQKTKWYKSDCGKKFCTQLDGYYELKKCKDKSYCQTIRADCVDGICKCPRKRPFYSGMACRSVEFWRSYLKKASPWRMALFDYKNEKYDSDRIVVGRHKNNDCLELVEIPWRKSSNNMYYVDGTVGTPNEDTDVLVFVNHRWLKLSDVNSDNYDILPWLNRNYSDDPLYICKGTENGKEAIGTFVKGGSCQVFDNGVAKDLSDFKVLSADPDTLY